MKREAATLFFLLAAAMPALACSCGPKPDAADFRSRAVVIVKGEVMSIVAPPAGRPGMTRARIRIERVVKGRATGSIVFETQSQPEACGYRFTLGQKGEFLARRDKGKLVTDACLMIGAGKD